MSIKKRGNIYHYHFEVAGRRYRGSTKEQTATRARLVESQLMARVKEGLLPTHLRKMPILRDYAVGFIKQVSFMPKKKSRLYYTNGCRLLSGTAVAGMRLDQIDQSACERLRFTGSGSNANCALRTLRRMLNVACKEGYLSRQAEIKLREENSRSAVLTPHEEAALLQCANQPLRDVILLVRDAGFRPAEAMALLWKNVDFFRNALYLERGKRKEGERWILMSDRLKVAMMERAKKTGTSDWVFPSRKGRGRGRGTTSGHLEGINKTFDRAKEKAKLPADIVLYSNRHTLATTLAEETGNPKLVQGMMGQTKMNTTMRYIHPGMKAAVDAVNKLNVDRAAIVLADPQGHNSRHTSPTIN